MNLKQSIQETLAALSRGELTEIRLVKLNHEQTILEERIINIEKESQYLASLLENNTSSGQNIEDLKTDYIFLLKKYRSLSEQLGMLVFEKEILKENIVDITQLKLKLKALLIMRASQLETLPVEVQEKITQLNKKLDAIFVIKAELDSIIQFAYKLQVRLSDLQEKVDMIAFNIGTLSFDRFSQQFHKKIWELNHQVATIQRQFIDFDDNISQVNRLQIKRKIAINFSIQFKKNLHKPLSNHNTQQGDLISLSKDIALYITQIAQLINAFKQERKINVNQIRSLEHQRNEILIKQ